MGRSATATHPVGTNSAAQVKTNSTQLSKVIENRESSEEAEAAKAMQFDTTIITPVMPEAKNYPSVTQNK